MYLFSDSVKLATAILSESNDDTADLAPGTHSSDGAASFRYFGVHPSAQGTGVGEAMVQWCIDTAGAAGRERIRIHTLESMPGAQRLYLRMGFLRDPSNDEEWDGIKGLAFVYHC